MKTIQTVLLLSLTLWSCNENKKHTRISAELADTNSPRVLGDGVISTGTYDTHAAFTPSGDSVLFLKCMPDISLCSICLSIKKNELWSQPEVVPISGKYLDVDPFVTKDGKKLFFVSNRPYLPGDSLNGSWDIWTSEIRDGSWGEPVHLDGNINSPEDEYYPTLADNGTLYFGSSRPGGNGGADIYKAIPDGVGWQSVENLGDSINTEFNEYEAFIAPDASYLIYMATKPNGLVNADFFYSVNHNGTWSKAMKLEGNVNSDATEWAPKVTRDGRFFYFGSTRNRLTDIPSHNLSLSELEQRLHQSGNGLGDIYYINFSSLKLK